MDFLCCFLARLIQFFGIERKPAFVAKHENVEEMDKSALLFCTFVIIAFRSKKKRKEKKRKKWCDYFPQREDGRGVVILIMRCTR